MHWYFPSGALSCGFLKLCKSLVITVTALAALGSTNFRECLLWKSTWVALFYGEKSVSSENWKGLKSWPKFLSHLIVPSFQGLCYSNCLPAPAGGQTVGSCFAFRASLYFYLCTKVLGGKEERKERDGWGWVLLLVSQNVQFAMSQRKAQKTVACY